MTPQLSSPGLYPPDNRPSVTLRNLALGILVQALRDVTKTTGVDCHRDGMTDWHADAIDWFACDADNPGTYRWVCEVLQANPRELRAWLSEYQTAGEFRKKQMAAGFKRFQIQH